MSYTIQGQYIQPSDVTVPIFLETGEQNYGETINNGFSAPQYAFEPGATASDYQRRVLNLAYLSNLWLRTVINGWFEPYDLLRGTSQDSLWVTW